MVQVLLCPNGDTGAIYFSRWLKKHTLTITKINSMKTFVFLEWKQIYERKLSNSYSFEGTKIIKQRYQNNIFVLLQPWRTEQELNDQYYVVFILSRILSWQNWIDFFILWALTKWKQYGSFGDWNTIYNHFKTFWDSLMFYQIFLSPEVKQGAIITYKHGTYELPNDLRFRILAN